MIDGIRPPRRPAPTGTPASQPRLTSPRPQPRIAPQPQLPSVASPVSPASPTTKVAPRRRRRWPWIVGGVLAAAVLCAAIVTGLYMYQLSPVKPGDSSRQRVTITYGMSPSEIAVSLKAQDLIRDTTAFDIYTRLSGTRNQLQAGRYSLSAGESTPQIVEHLRAGRADTFQITFYPGATLRDTWSQPDKRSDVVTMLSRAGYPEAEIAAALAKSYTHPLFAGKPAGTSLEGYVYGETYTVDASASVEDILKITFDQYWQEIQNNNLVEAFAEHGLNLYQGITLASIVQREVSHPPDQAQVAQVFYRRLASDTVLGSDVTFIYAAHMQGVVPSVQLDSPYNTRRVKGLPPGPIAVPGLSALTAVAHPASGDYMYFVAGEDGKTYFARTEAEHNQNIRDHCGVLCQ